MAGFVLIERRKTTQGQVYFLNVVTGESTWYDPRVPRYVASTACVKFTSSYEVMRWISKIAKFS